MCQNLLVIRETIKQAADSSDEVPTLLGDSISASTTGLPCSPPMLCLAAYFLKEDFAGSRSCGPCLEGPKFRVFFTLICHSDWPVSSTCRKDQRDM